MTLINFLALSPKKKGLIIMYLNRLSPEQKTIFLDICIHAANANNDFANEEKLYIRQYCEEMQLEVRYETNSDIKELIPRLVRISTKEELKMITVELMGLLLSDHYYDNFEKEFMNYFSKEVELTSQEIQQITDAFNELNVLYEKFNKIIFGSTMKQ